MFRLRNPPLLAILVVLLGWTCVAQVGQKVPASDVHAIAGHSTSMAEAGHCLEAMPQLKKTIRQLSDKELKRRVGLDGVRCAMTLNQIDDALDFLQVLGRDFPKDPEVLYVSTHAYSDLSTRASQQLASASPSSYQAHELLAESFETQGKWDQAAVEYRAILKTHPQLPGLHFRLGRLLLSKPDPGQGAAEEARKEMQQELAIDPGNAGAEYVLGELARQGQQWDDAIAHFAQAAKLDVSFSDAYLGLGASLLQKKRFPEAISPLETAVKLEPRNPDAHYNLAMAYSRVGRKQDAEKEFAVHRRMTLGGEGGPGTTSGSASGSELPPSP
jgi:tetratricopeptide (TPR) repeat protein